MAYRSCQTSQFFHGMISQHTHLFTVLTFYHVPGLSFFRLLPVPVSTYRTGYDVGIACVIIRWRILETPACIGDPASIRGFTVYNYQGA